MAGSQVGTDERGYRWVSEAEGDVHIPAHPEVVDRIGQRARLLDVREVLQDVLGSGLEQTVFVAEDPIDFVLFNFNGKSKK